MRILFLTLFLLFTITNSALSILLPTDDVASCKMPDQSLYYYPVIGIVSHPGNGTAGEHGRSLPLYGDDDSYIAASYVKFVESGGARVIPILYNEPEEVILEKLKLVNGVIFTGGRAKYGPYVETLSKIFQVILDRNDGGDYFPLLAICLGFELVNMIVSKDNKILESFSAHNHASILQFVDETSTNTSVFKRFPPDLIQKLSTDCITIQNHIYGLSPKRIQSNDALSNFFRILTTTPDKNGKVYVSSIQAYDYPITGLQWHPEKTAFEWGLSNIPHTEDSALATHYTASYFISETRKSSNRPSMKKVLDNLIYNYQLTYLGKDGTGYDEVYVFH
ncbi:hypothetical protein LUZ60_008440 [Juncus effusus]|nr:hypothetical protein LUZ60_008440 [Juncus effusus]